MPFFLPGLPGAFAASFLKGASPPRAIAFAARLLVLAEDFPKSAFTALRFMIFCSTRNLFASAISLSFSAICFSLAAMSFPCSSIFRSLLLMSSSLAARAASISAIRARAALCTICSSLFMPKSYQKTG